MSSPLRLFGCALSFLEKRSDEMDPSIAVRWMAGCASFSIKRREIVLQLNMAPYGFLADQRRGLTVWEGTAGVYFAAKLAATDFARSVWENVASGRVVGVCTYSPGYHCLLKPYARTVTAVELHAINLLLTPAVPHSRHAFVTTSRAVFQERIARLEQRQRGWMARQLAETSRHSVQPSAYSG